MTQPSGFLPRRAAMLCAWIVLLVQLGLATAQAPVKFDPKQHLDGYEACLSSRYSDLYPFDAYEHESGKELGPTELELLRTRWIADKQRVAKEIEALQADPREDYVHTQRRELLEHPAFAGVTFSFERPHPTLLFLVQDPPTPAPERSKALAEEYAGWLRKAQQVFVLLYAEPLHLDQRSDYPAFAIALLCNERDYKKYLDVKGVPFSRTSPAYYDEAAKLVVAFEPTDANEASRVLLRGAILRAFARAQEHARYKGKGDPEQPLWLADGIAQYLSYHEGAQPEVLDRQRLDTAALERVVALFKKPADRDLFLHPVEDLVQCFDGIDVYHLAENRAEALKQSAPARDAMSAAFDAQSATWVYFMQNGQAGKLKPAFMKYMQSALNGRAGLDAFFNAFEQPNMAALNRDFYEWACTEFERLHPKDKVDRTPLTTLFADRVPPPPPEAPRKPKHMPVVDATAPAVNEKSIASPAFVVSLVASSFDPAPLAIDAKDFEALHSLALVQVKKGDLDSALKNLRDALAAKPAAPEDERIAREIERIEQWTRVRDAYLENLRKSAAPWILKYQGQMLTTSIVKVENGDVYLGENKAGLSKIPLKTIEPYEIAKQAGKKEDLGGAEPWVRFYPYVLAGESKWETLLKEPSEKGNALRNDAKDWYPVLLATGPAALALDKISKASEPRTAKDTTKLLASVKELLATHKDVPLIQRKRESLMRLCAAVLMKTYVERNPIEIVHGACNDLGGGKLDIVYEFDKKEEGDDFIKLPGYLAGRHEELDKLKTNDEHSVWGVKDGDWIGIGGATYQHILDFSGPIKLTYTLRFPMPSRPVKARPSWMFAVCDDGNESFAALVNFKGLYVKDRVSGYTGSATDEGKQITYAHPYHFQLVNDGTTLTAYLDEEKMSECSIGSLKKGRVMAWFHTDGLMAIERLEIEGTLDPGWKEGAKRSFLSSKLSELGFN